MTIKRFTAISTLLLLAALGCFGQAAPVAPVTPAAPVAAAEPLTILTMVGSFYDGGSHHAAMRVGGFIPLSDATSTAKTNWIGLVADMGFGANTRRPRSMHWVGGSCRRLARSISAPPPLRTRISSARSAPRSKDRRPARYSSRPGTGHDRRRQHGSNYGYQAATGAVWTSRSTPGCGFTRSRNTRRAASAVRRLASA